MKIKKSLIIISFAVLCSVTVAAKSKDSYKPSVQTEVKLDKYNRQLGYQLINNGETVVFVFDGKRMGIEHPKRVFVEGSFNGWAKKDVNWELAQIDDKNFSLEVSKIDVLVPGNSGHPEFRYYVIAEVPYTETVCGKELQRFKKQDFELEPVSKIPGFKADKNNLILFPQDDPLEVVANEELAKKVKKLKEFDLSKPEDVAAISNFRLVPGTTNLYRGYHPYKISRGKFDTEKTRLELVCKQLKEKGVKTIITLSGDEALIDGKEFLPVFITDIRRNKSELFVETKYNTVYYQSTGKEFGTMIAEIVRYINSHEGPYYVHCRLGTDRTGVVSAVLAALSGAEWKSIAEDYQKSNLMGIQEFRDYRLLQYSFEQMIGVPMAEVKNLQTELGQYFIDRSFLTKEEIDLLGKNLNK